MDVWPEQAVLVNGKQHNRGQEAAGLACVKLQANPGEEYMFRERGLGAGAITEIFNNVHQQYKDLTEEQLHDAEFAKNVCLLPVNSTWDTYVIPLREKAEFRMYIRSSAATTGGQRTWHYAVTST